MNTRVVGPGPTKWIVTAAHPAEANLVGRFYMSGEGPRAIEASRPGCGTRKALVDPMKE